LDINRGDIVTVAPPGEFGKPRPALVLQRRIYPETELITVALVTTDQHALPDVRIQMYPSSENGLQRGSYVMVDSVQTYRRSKVGSVIGKADQATMRRVRDALVIFLGFDQDE
jgi:mRNA interferase MazF